MYFAYINSMNKLIGMGVSLMQTDDYGSADVKNIEISENIYNAYIEDNDRFIYQDGEIVANPDYEETKTQKEKERIGNLTMTKRVFALGLQQLGITYSQLKELIATSEQAQLEWDLCVELQRKNPLLDIMAAQMGVTSEQLDNMFKQANGENPEIYAS